MSDPLTKQQRAFKAVAQKGDLRGAVRLARGVVRRVIWAEGIDVDPIDISEKLAGEFERDATTAAMSWDSACEYAYAALAIGIAIGQLVSPDAFTERDGVR